MSFVSSVYIGIKSFFVCKCAVPVAAEKKNKLKGVNGNGKSSSEED